MSLQNFELASLKDKIEAQTQALLEAAEAKKKAEALQKATKDKKPKGKRVDKVKANK